MEPGSQLRTVIRLDFFFWSMNPAEEESPPSRGHCSPPCFLSFSHEGKGY